MNDNNTRGPEIFKGSCSDVVEMGYLTVGPFSQSTKGVWEMSVRYLSEEMT